MRNVLHAISEINAAFAVGDLAAGMEVTRRLMAGVVQQELQDIALTAAAAIDGPFAAFSALNELSARLGGALELVEVTNEYVDFFALKNPLLSFSCIELPPDAVERAAVPGISEALAQLCPGLVLEPQPSLGANTYRIRLG